MQFGMQFRSSARHGRRSPRARRVVVALVAALAVVVAGPALAIALEHHQRTGHQTQAGQGTPAETSAGVAPGSSRGRVPAPTASATPEPTAEPTPEPTVEPEPEPTVAPSTTPKPTETAPPVAAQPAGPGAQIEADIVAATNAQRAANGLGALSVSSCATDQVTSRVAQLVAENGFYHPPLGPVVDACKAGAGENLALGYSDGAAVVDGWMNSPGHRENLLRQTYVSVGVSCQLQNARWLCGAVYLTS